jgi:hypothetical protein
MARKLETNEDLLVDLLNYSPYGALCQSFIIQAIQSFASGVIESKQELLKQEEDLEKQGKISLISHKAWVGIAEDVNKRMNEFYNK